MARSARALVVELVADTKDFVKGTQDADKALDRFTASGSKGLDALERKAREVSNEIAHGKTKEQFGEAGSEVGAEFATNLGSSLAAGDITTIAQDTAGGLVSAFTAIGGPIGVAFAGVATAATVIFANMQKKAQESADRISAVFDKVSESIQDVMSESERGVWFKKALEQMGGEKGLPAAMEKLDSWTRKTGVSAETISAALKAGGSPLDLVIKRLQTVIAQGTTLEGQGNRLHAVRTEQAVAAQHQLDFLKNANKEIEKGIGAGERYAAVQQVWVDRATETVAQLSEMNRQLRLAGRSPISPRNRRG